MGGGGGGGLLQNNVVSSTCQVDNIMATVESFSRWRLKREPFVRAKEVLNGKLPTKLISNFLLHF